MKTPVLTSSDSKVARSTRNPGRGHDSSTYASASETRALLANSLAARSERLGAGDLVSTDEAAGIAGTTRVTINAWIDKGRCIGLAQTKRGFKLPKWQFEPRLWEALPKLSAALNTKDGWLLLAFLETPHGALGGIAPRAAIEQGKLERVLSIAEHEGN
ncbi:MAG TPA: hypothetical protein VF169_08950 [Albitalea sp.]|uniref:hypothetical protein n=1 Tax=Piscinibacter sp. TaxID=1903157 RepID=UPI002ED3B88D